MRLAKLSHVAYRAGLHAGATNLGGGGPGALTFGPYMIAGKALYYTTFAGGGGTCRIVYTGS